ncbi:MAG: cytidyltransferase-like protein, partial [Akkermansiaceae bacterium]
MTDQSQHGLLLGKFLPPHNGHLYLGNFARHFVKELTIVVGTLPT